MIIIIIIIHIICIDGTAAVNIWVVDSSWNVMHTVITGGEVKGKLADGVGS